MKRLKFITIALSLIALSNYSACSSSVFDNPPNQADVDITFEGFIISMEALIDEIQLFDVTTCSELETLVNNLVDSVDCDDGGTSTIVVENFVCQDGPPLEASFSIAQVDDNCEENAETTDGSISAFLSYDGTTATITSSSEAFTIDDLLWTFVNFIFTEDSSFNITCSGTPTVNKQECTAASDCSTCQLN